MNSVRDFTEPHSTDLTHLPVWNNIDKPKQLPGPSNLPLLGAALSVGSIRNFYKSMVQWLEQYGDPFYARFGQHGYVFTCNTELTKLILESRPTGATRPEMTRKAFASIDAKEMLFSAEGAQWKLHRKAISKSLSAHNLAVAEKLIKAEVDQQLDRFEKALDASPTGKVDFLPVAKRYSVTIISKLVFGADFRNISSDDSVVQDIGVIFNTLARRISMPFAYWNYFKLPIDKKYDQIKQALNQDIQDWIDKARTHLANQGADYRADNLLEGMLMDAGDGEAILSDKEIIDNCIGLIAAGLDTTSTTLSWAVYLLGRRPDIIKRLRAELDAATAGTGDLPTLQGIHTLPLFEAVIWEALRLYPAAPFLPAMTTRDFEFEGQRIPKGSTFIFLTSEAEKQQPGYDPEFNPDRWFAEGMLAKAVKQLPMPFGTGQRLCPGRNLSVMEMKAMLAGLVHRFDWETSAEDLPDQFFNFTIEPSSTRVTAHRLGF